MTQGWENKNIIFTLGEQALFKGSFILPFSNLTKSNRLIEKGKWLNEYNLLFYMTYCFTSESSSYF